MPKRLVNNTNDIIFYIINITTLLHTVLTQSSIKIYNFGSPYLFIVVEQRIFKENKNVQ